MELKVSASGVMGPTCGSDVLDDEMMFSSEELDEGAIGVSAEELGGIVKESLFSIGFDGFSTTPLP